MTVAESIELHPDVEAVGTARRFVRRGLEHLGTATAEVIDALVLAGNELVTNAVLHARTEFRVTVRRVSGALRVEVLDANTRVPETSAAPLDATTGRGLRVVEGLGLRWGVESHPSGKTVWVEAPLPSPPGDALTSSAAKA